VKILVTGSAGFVGYFLTCNLLKQGHCVVGIDNMNDYYDVNLKNDRNEMLLKNVNYTFYKDDISDCDRIDAIFKAETPEVVINCAAQAGVRYSIENPMCYIKSNVNGFAVILEMCRHYKVKHLIFASSSSVYGINGKVPFSEHDNVDHPVSLYAATKKGNELLAHSYADLYNIPVTGLRFFTVYGPYGRPDMAYFKFTKAILEGTPIDVYNNGDMYRDFTYIDDIVEGISRLITIIPQPNDNWDNRSQDPALTRAPYRIYNIGNNTPIALSEFIETIERHTGKKALKRMLPMQKGDVPRTYADISDLHKATGFSPVTTLDEGIKKFVDWYTTYYR
jgi:UDP-glucuronate 4-epimerase